jgi:hypothetical protein
MTTRHEAAADVDRGQRIRRNRRLLRAASSPVALPALGAPVQILDFLIPVVNEPGRHALSSVVGAPRLRSMIARELTYNHVSRELDSALVPPWSRGSFFLLVELA